MSEQRGDAEDLRLAQELIARQALEIEALKAGRADHEFAAELRQLLRQAGAAVALRAPAEADALLESLVQTAALVIGAQAASLLELDAEGSQLAFRVAIGPKAAAVREFTVPLGRGIVGLVAETGQPMAVSDVAEDPRFFKEIAQSVQYVPESILCVPVRRDDAVIGVFELLDKRSGSFNTQDIDLAGRFATQMALALEHARGSDAVEELLLEGLRQLAGGQSISAGLEEEVASFARRAREEDRQTETLARAIAAIGRQGEAEAALVNAWIGSFLEYLRAREALFR